MSQRVTKSFTRKVNGAYVDIEVSFDEDGEVVTYAEYNQTVWAWWLIFPYRTTVRRRVRATRNRYSSGWSIQDEDFLDLMFMDLLDEVLATLWFEYVSSEYDDLVYADVEDYADSDIDADTIEEISSDLSDDSFAIDDGLTSANDSIDFEDGLDSSDIQAGVAYEPEDVAVNAEPDYVPEPYVAPEPTYSSSSSESSSSWSSDDSSSRSSGSSSSYDSDSSDSDSDD